MENISKVLESGNSEEKIKILETLDKTDNPEILEKIISKLDDDDIKVRGEAFSSLVLNKNSDFSIYLLKPLHRQKMKEKYFLSRNRVDRF